jgi:hypothetical protein
MEKREEKTCPLGTLGRARHGLGEGHDWIGPGVAVAKGMIRKCGLGCGAVNSYVLEGEAL